MSDEELLGKIKKGAGKSAEAAEKGLKKGWDETKHLGKEIKDSKPGEATEEGAKKGWGRLKGFGKKVKDTVTEEEK